MQGIRGFVQLLIKPLTIRISPDGSTSSESLIQLHRKQACRNPASRRFACCNRCRLGKWAWEEAVAGDLYPCVRCSISNEWLPAAVHGSGG